MAVFASGSGMKTDVNTGVTSLSNYVEGAEVRTGEAISDEAAAVMSSDYSAPSGGPKNGDHRISWSPCYTQRVSSSRGGYTTRRSKTMFIDVYFQAAGGKWYNIAAIPGYSC